MKIEPNKGKKLRSPFFKSSTNKINDNISSGDRNTSIQFKNTIFQGLLDDFDQDLQGIIQELDSLGEILVEKRDWQTMVKYKSRVSRFITIATDKYLQIKDDLDYMQSDFDFLRPSSRKKNNRRLYTIQTINQKLEKLTSLVLERQADKIEILAMLGEIKGLIVNIIN